MATTGLEMRVFVIDDDGLEHEITDEIDTTFELTIEPVKGARERYEHFLKTIKPISLTFTFRAYRWLGEVGAGLFSFSKN